MICVTAKSTEVNRRRTVRPIRSKTSGAGGRADSAHVVTGLAIARSSGGSDGGRFGSGRRLGGRRALRRPGRARGCRDRGLERPREGGNDIGEGLQSDV